MKVKSESEGAQSYPTLRDPMDCSLPGSSVLGIFQARVLEWGAIAFSKDKSSGRYYQSYLTNEKTEKLANFPKIHRRQVLGIHVGQRHKHTFN